MVAAMKMAFVLFDGMTSMDFAGFYEAVTWLVILKTKENVSWTFCADKDEITDDRGLKMKSDEVLPDLGDFDLVFFPVDYQLECFDLMRISWAGSERQSTYRIRFLFVQGLCYWAQQVSRQKWGNPLLQKKC